MRTVHIAYLGGNIYGGWVTYTAHLVKALEAIGIRVKLYKIHTREERHTHHFGYECQYRNITIEMAKELCKNEAFIISAVNKNFTPIAEELFAAGAKIIMHARSEFYDAPESMQKSPERCVVIRKELNEFIPGSVFIPHPYVRVLSQTTNGEPRSVLATSTSRIDFDKYTEILLDANRLLDDDMKIHIWGFENRIFSMKHLVKQYPEWTQSKAGYSNTTGIAVFKLAKSTFMVDMSDIKQEGGGTQYTTLEGWDAGAVAILNKQWIKPNGQLVVGENCYAVSGSEATGGQDRVDACAIGGKELADLLKKYKSSTAMQDDVKAMELRGYEELAKHAPEIVGNQYADWLGV